MTRQITEMWQVQDGKRYFLLKVVRGEVKTAIAKASVTKEGKPIVYKLNVIFAIEDMNTDPGFYPGPAECDYIAELD